MKNDNILTMPIKEFSKRIDQAEAHANGITDVLAGIVGMTPAARLHATGKYRVGEATALASVLVAAEKKPALFESLATLDDGVDPDRFEPEVLRDRLTRVELLQRLIEALTHVMKGLNDTELHLGNSSRPVLLAAYDIAKSHAKRDGALADAIRPALDYYARVARAALSTKRAKKQAAAKPSGKSQT